MDTPPERLRFGPYRLLRELDGCAVADRLLALHERRQTSHVVYRFPVLHDAAERRRFLAAVDPLASLNHPHLLPVEEYSFGGNHRAWLVTPYTGSQVGLMTLSRLLAEKGGSMAPSETQRALTHTLEAVHAAHEDGLVHGPIQADEILIDRRGSATIELYGLVHRLRRLTESVKGGLGDHPGPDAGDLRRQEIASVVRLGYRLLTGCDPAMPHVSATRVVRRLDRRWDGFFAAGLAERGFCCAAEALAALPGGTGAPSVPAKPARGPTVPLVSLRSSATAANLL